MTERLMNLKERLEEKTGVQIDVHEVSKNGVRKIGFVFRIGTISPTIYPEDFLDLPDDEVIDKIIEMFERGKDRVPAFDPDKEFDPETFDDSRCFAGLCHHDRVPDDAIARPYLDLCIYVYYKVGDFGSITITHQILEHLKRDKESLIDIAIANSMAVSTVNNILDAIKELAEQTGMIAYPEQCDDTPPMYVLSNQSGIRGAISLLNMSAIKELAEINNSDLYILPSSVHEVIAVPKLDQPAETIQGLVHLVNTTEIQPEDLLSDSVYEYSRKYGEIHIA